MYGDGTTNRPTEEMVVYREVLLPVTIKLFINELINDEYYTYTYVYMKTVYINKNGSFATYIKKFIAIS